MGLTGVFDEAAKIITITLTSINDPLFAIGRASIASNIDNSNLVWVAVAVVVIIVLILAILIARRYVITIVER